MLNFIIGFLIAGAIFIYYFQAKKHQYTIKWWQWIVTILWLCYTGFVIKLVEGFLLEEAGRAALVMGIIFGFVSVITGVLLFRFVYRKMFSHE